jgi:uncharacterized lipoprotein
MKTMLLSVVAVLAVSLLSACSSGVTVGTRHHHVSVGGEIGR